MQKDSQMSLILHGIAYNKISELYNNFVKPENLLYKRIWSVPKWAKV